ncbi:MAG: hypothetical protein ACTHMA_19260 [Thermomicrobiales bacterium]
MGDTNGDNQGNREGGNDRPILRIARRPREAGQAPPNAAHEADGTAAARTARVNAAARAAETPLHVSGETATTPTRVTAKQRAATSAKNLVAMANAGATIIGGPTAAMTVAEKGLIETGAVGLAQRNPKRAKQVEDNAAPMALFVGCAMWIARIVKERRDARPPTLSPVSPELAQNWASATAESAQIPQPEWEPVHTNGYKPPWDGTLYEGTSQYDAIINQTKLN